MKMTFDTELFGLEPRDMLVYETLLSCPDDISIRTLAAKTRLNRGTAFEVMKKLVACGLVAAHYKGSRKHYRALDPSSVQSYAERRSQAIVTELTKVDNYVTSLEAISKFDATGQFGQLYEGQDEIALLLQDVLSTVAAIDSKSYRVVSSAEVSNHLYAKFRNFTRQRIRLKLSVRVLAIGGEDSLAGLAERKVLSSEQIPPGYIIIYGSKVAQISLNHAGDIQGSVVDNAGIAQLQSVLFDALWEAV